MNRYLRWILSALLPLALLAGCATPPVRGSRGDAAQLAGQAAREKALAGADRWTLAGRLYVSNGKDGGTVSLAWTQDGARYDFVVHTPVTGRSFRLSGDAGGALLEGLDGGPQRGADAESLLRRALGWEVPLAGLRAWVLGLRVPGAPAELEFGPDGLPVLLRQAGWQVAYRAWDTARQPPLPSKVFADDPAGGYKVRLSIESWQLR
jgi:outer membrane lipoprotein LolB